MKAPKVIFFDVNESLLDLGNMKKSIATILEGKEELLPLWFTTMLQYSSVTTLSQQYTNFDEIGAAALQMVAANNNVSLSSEKAKEAMKSFSSLPPHREVVEALNTLRSAGYKMVALSNSSSDGLATQLKNAGLTDLFDEIISVEQVGKFKPDSSVYLWASKKMDAQPEDCMMIAAHGWDVAGAMWAGWQAAFIARPGQQLYTLAPKPQINEPNLLLIAEKLVGLK
ncbi:haloacid dehalogenase type II [Flavobacterium algicola]|uniref:haloacid dehalogenase type II n=1 Tax=Flavobacterium algicola TaxID=556529 RepID=UPI001EFDDEAB|nr:haloacid dehalogenase type II [Flavobacterium algicola]MCG9791581.1 haloacid dehalogenase type II [Flavobacterium algicola]